MKRFRGTFNLKYINIDNYESLQLIRYQIIALKMSLLQCNRDNSPAVTSRNNATWRMTVMFLIKKQAMSII